MANERDERDDMTERLDRVEACLTKISASIDSIVDRLLYLDQKADQIAGQHWDLVDELSDSSSLDEPEPEPDDADPPVESGQGQEQAQRPARFRVA